MPHHFFHQACDIYNPTLKLFQGGLYGVDNLDPNLLINGVSVLPTVRYKGGDASAAGWPAWEYGSTLDLEAGHTPTYNMGSPLLGPNDDSVLFNKGGWYEYSDSTLGDITTEDIVVEIIFKNKNIQEFQFGKYRAADARGWTVYTTTSNFMYLYIRDNTGLVQVATGATLVQDAWYHAICFVNRNENTTNGSQWYLNGISSGTGVNFSTRVNSIATNSKFGIGSNTQDVFTGTSTTIAYCAMWKRADWHQAGAAGPAEWSNVAKERFMRLSGFWPSKAEGTSLYTFTRNSIAALDKVENGARKIYYVGANWPRLVSRNDANGNNIKGYLSEIPFYNNLYLSEDFISGWSCVNTAEDTNCNRAADGDMEAAGVTSWATISSATLTKQPGTPHGGSQCLRIARNTGNNPGARQSTLLIGSRYRAIAWARSDGYAIPAINAGGVRLWTGTVSTSWQAVDVTFYNCGANYFDIYALTSVAGQYAEWDDVTIHELFPLDDFGNRIIDGYMEYSGTASWTAENGATLTKETTGPYDGYQVLRVARNGTNSPSASQNILTDGYNYRLTGWCRSDGTAKPIVWMGGTLLFTGTVSTIWQPISVIGTYGTDGLIKLGSDAVADTKYVEFDYIRVSQLYPSPDKQDRATCLIADTTYTQHGICRGISGNFSSVWSVFAKKGNKDWLYFYFEYAWGDAYRTGWCYFNLANGTTGTVATAPSVRAPYRTYMEDWGDGWYRCVCLTIASATTGHLFKIQPAQADGDLTFAGDGSTVNTYIWGAQMRYQYAQYPSTTWWLQRTAEINSYIPVLTNAGVLKAADVLYYKGDDGNIGSRLEGTMSADFMVESETPNGTTPNIINVNKDGSNATSAILRLFDTDGHAQCYNGVTGTGEGTDGVIHKKALGTWSSDRISVSVDGELLEKKP